METIEEMNNLVFHRSIEECKDDANCKECAYKDFRDEKREQRSRHV